MHPFVNTAVRAARKAGETIVRGLARFEGVETYTKGLNDFVTSIDRAAEAEIITILQTAYPHHAFLAEESGASGNADTTWIIDPLDGTTNFMHGFPQFAVSIACQVNDRIEHAVVYDPMRQEIFTATRGSGAYLENRRLRVSRQRTLQGALIGTGFPYRENLHYLDPYMAMLKTVMQTAAGVRRPGAAALDLAYVAAGRTDAFFEIGLKAWWARSTAASTGRTAISSRATRACTWRSSRRWRRTCRRSCAKPPRNRPRRKRGLRPWRPCRPRRTTRPSRPGRRCGPSDSRAALPSRPAG